MIILNFSHPISDDQTKDIESLTGQEIERIYEIPVQFDNQESFIKQLKELMSELPLTSNQLQTESILIILPALNFITGILLAELHGRMGYFPSIVRIRPVSGSLPPRFEVAEILNLQEIRDLARATRHG